MKFREEDDLLESFECSVPLEMGMNGQLFAFKMATNHVLTVLRSVDYLKEIQTILDKLEENFLLVLKTRQLFSTYEETDFCKGLVFGQIGAKALVNFANIGVTL